MQCLQEKVHCLPKSTLPNSYKLSYVKWCCKQFFFSFLHMIKDRCFLGASNISQLLQTCSQVNLFNGEIQLCKIHSTWRMCHMFSQDSYFTLLVNLKMYEMMLSKHRANYFFMSSAYPIRLINSVSTMSPSKAMDTACLFCKEMSVHFCLDKMAEWCADFLGC